MKLSNTAYLGICDPSTYIYVLTKGRKLRGPFADGSQKEGADCVRTRAGGRPGRAAAGAQSAPGRRSSWGGRPPRRTPSPG